MKAKLHKPAELYGRRSMCTPRPGFRLGQARTRDHWRKVSRRIETRRAHLEWATLLPPWRLALLERIRAA